MIEPYVCDFIAQGKSQNPYFKEPQKCNILAKMSLAPYKAHLDFFGIFFTEFWHASSPSALEIETLF